ncbi:hypothetical protein POM88_049000 [Heracleum sosnowskyi]|uniref:DC1 domain-containing protein n=1 Tax=Heracleum sosnowskyi TaxID=360622 RepID=A0AAD8M107_9APIA|nr:hypothetical protein POM88_049000 [Heracleum sosnowskyi]
MATTIKLVHVSHSHPLMLIEDFDSSSVAAPLVCCLCETPVIGLSPAYTCSQEHSPCLFFLHKRCAESAKFIKHFMHPEHQLDLRKNYQHTKINWLMFKVDTVCFFCAACTREINPDMSGKNVIKVEGDDEQKYPDLMQFPRYSTDSLVADFIAVLQSGKLMNNNSTIEEEVDKEKESPLIFHWSHWEHPLILLKELKKADDSDDDGSDTNNRIDEMLVWFDNSAVFSIVILVLRPDS